MQAFSVWGQSDLLKSLSSADFSVLEQDVCNPFSISTLAGLAACNGIPRVRESENCAGLDSKNEPEKGC